MDLIPGDLRGLLRRGGKIILRHHEKIMPLPYIKANPEIRPHILCSPFTGLRNDWLYWIGDLGLVVYKAETKGIHRFTCVPRLLRVPPFDGYFSPPEHASFGGFPARVVDYIHVPRNDKMTLIQHFDNWFGWQGRDLNGAPWGPPVGLWSDKPLAPTPIDEAPEDDAPLTEPPTYEPNPE